MLIGEVAARSGISTRMLRHYDSLGLVSASTRTTNASERLRLVLSLKAPDQSRNVALLIKAALQEDDTNAGGALDWTLAQIGDDVIPPVQQALQAPHAQRRHRAVTIPSCRSSDRLPQVMPWQMPIRIPTPSCTVEQQLPTDAVADTTP